MWGQEVLHPEVRDSSQVSNSRTSTNSNTVPVPVYEEVQVPTCSSSTSIQRGAWKSENSLFDRPSPTSNSPEVRPAVRPTAPAAASEAIRPGTTTEKVRRRSGRPAELCQEVRRRSDGEARPVEREQDRVNEQAVRRVRPGDAHTNSPEVRPSRSYPNYVNGFAPTTEDSGKQVLRKFDRMMSAISAITPMEFGLIGLITSTRTDRTTCIPHWRTRRRSRSFTTFNRMTSAITPMEFGLTASMWITSAITPEGFGLTASIRTTSAITPSCPCGAERILLPSRIHRSQKTS